MSRLAPIVSLLLGLAGQLDALQARTPAAWTLASGDYTIYGHTEYNPTLTLVPRVVFDTAQGVDSARVVDSVRAAAPIRGGLAAGLSAWPIGQYCDGPATAAVQPLPPRELLQRVQLADRCGVRLVIVPPRRFLTTTGETAGPFSVDSARRLIDRYAAALPPDTLRKYRATLLGMNLADDYNCARCWGGKIISQAQIAEWAAYARTRLPGLPLGVRKTPDWVAASPGLASQIDYAWAQYDTKDGDPQAYYDEAASVARRLGIRVVMGVNVEDCHGVSTAACGAADLVRFGGAAVRHPESCAFLSWRYNAATWDQPEVRAAWDELLAMARSRPAQECRRTRVGA